MVRNNKQHTGRRKFIAAMGAAGLAGLAGCTSGDGGDGGDENQIRMRTTTSSSAAYAMNEGIAAVVNENTDEVFVEARPGEGSEANVNALVRDEVEMIYMQSWTMYDLLNNIGPFSEVDLEVYQTFHYYDLHNFLCTNQDWMRMDEIEEGAAISPTPSGAGGRPLLTYMLDEYAIGEDNYEALSVDFGEQASAFSDGTLDVGYTTIINSDVVPGWGQEMKQTVDLNLLGWPEDQHDAMEEDERVTLSELDMTGEFEWFADMFRDTPDTVYSPYYPYVFLCKPELEYDKVDELMRTMYDNREVLKDYHSMLGQFEDDDWWISDAYPQVPFHPAAADFFEEIGVWQDDFTRGEEMS